MYNDYDDAEEVEYFDEEGAYYEELSDAAVMAGYDDADDELFDQYDMDQEYENQYDLGDQE